MDIEQKQAEIIDLFVKRASACKGEGDALGSILVEATSHPWLFAFSEILALSYVAEVLSNLCLFLTFINVHTLLH